MLVLFETSAGFAVFKLLDEKKLKEADNVFKDFETPEKASKLLKLKQFVKFKDTADALAGTSATVEGKLCKSLKKMLKKLFVKEAHESLAVADTKLGNAIKEKLNIQCVSNSAIHELMRCIRSHMEILIDEVQPKELSAMSLGLAHSLSRYKLKFSPDKVDTMIVQAVSLLDDLDKELNNYMMRCREWYGWHFPELVTVIPDNVTYVKTVKALGIRNNIANVDFSGIITAEQEESMKEKAEISIGSEISEIDIANILFLCDQVLEMSQYRIQLFEYLQNRMMAIAPNLTSLVGELVGARLISHAGSLLNLAKQPASTVQILGAEKALFRALKTKHSTPKYGLIYHAQIIGQSTNQLKGKMARMLAAKAALAIRVDALGDGENQNLGIEHRAKLELRLKSLEEGDSRRISGTGRSSARFDRYQHKSHVQQYNANEDNTIPTTKRKFEDYADGETEASVNKKKKFSDTTYHDGQNDVEEEPATPNKKRKKQKVEEVPVEVSDDKPKKKKKKQPKEEEVEEPEADVSKKPKKKKKQKVN
ncbi:Nucleolar protein 58 [Chamberlinius hualienensis]